MDEYFIIGKIVNTQGNKGEIRIVPSTSRKERFENLKQLTVKKNNKFETYEVEKFRYHKQFIVFKLKGINNISDGETLKTYEVVVSKENAIQLKSNEYFWEDILNMEVFEVSGEFLGILEDVIETGANDVYLIKKENTKDLLIPAIKQCIINIDIEKNKMIVELLEGLR